MDTLEQIKNSDYSTLVGIVKERNRPSGGIRTLHEFARGSFLTERKKVLEVGSNTGFSVVNMALLSKAQCCRVDINKNSIDEAREYAKKMGADNLTEFKVGDALNIPYPDNYFDAIWVSNVTSFIDKKEQALKEYFRVLKPFGYLGVAPIYYIKQPPKDLFVKVEELVGTKINVRDLEGWESLIKQSASMAGVALEQCFCKDYIYEDQQDNIDSWLDRILKKDHLEELNADVKAELKERYTQCMKVFNENLKYCGFSLMLYQKRIVRDEDELFITRGL